MGSDATRAPIPLSGEIDLGNATEIAEKLEAAIAETPNTVVCLDCADLEFIDSSGLAVLLRLDARLQQQGRSLVLLRVPKRLHQVFTITGVDHLIGSSTP